MKPREWVFCRRAVPLLASVMGIAAGRERARMVHADLLAMPSDRGTTSVAVAAGRGL